MKQTELARIQIKNMDIHVLGAKLSFSEGGL